MGVAISGMHYTGMHAANFPVGSVCSSAGILNASQLGGIVILSSMALLIMTLFTSTLDTRMQLTASLKSSNDQLRLANAELKQRALLDSLTGLPNRQLFDDRLQHALARLQRSEGRAQVAVLFVGLDGFKPINDSLGHAAGDLVLKEVGLRLCSAARTSDTVARIGGDEFVLLMEGLTNVADSSALAQRIVLALARPLQLGGQQVHLAGSVGIAHYPAHGPSDKLMAHADAAMYAAKRSGGNTYVVFEPQMAAGAAQQLSLKFDLSRAVAAGQLSLLYQPKVDTLSGKLCGVEALLRWQHPERGAVSPAVFIPLAERYGLISELGQWVIDEACGQMQAWERRGLVVCVAINLSAHQLRREELPERIRQALERHHVDPARLLCEITESVAMEDIQAMQRACDGLQRIGVFLSIDDFGTGYSSLSYLRQLPARQLKIDRSFINDLETSDDARAVVDAVIKLAHALSLSVVAEGVETAGQRDILRTLRCDELQGYFFARPMPADALLAWAAGNTGGVAHESQ
jgi:diguanylate cyclase (GGDEF)-like protein